MKTTSGLTWSAMPTNASPSSAVALRDGCGIGVAATAAAGCGDTIDAAALVCFGRLSVDANASPNTNAIATRVPRSEEHTSELQSQSNLVCRLLLGKKQIRL